MPHPLISKLGEKEHAGSKPRCHWMTHGPRHEVAHRLTALIEPWGCVSTDDRWMPEGFEQLEEAQLHKASTLLNSTLSQQLREWWLVVATPQSKTPNIDIASTCKVCVNGTEENGLLLVEAKAHTKELHRDGKRLRKRTPNSLKNHERIRDCIADAADGLTTETDLNWSLSRDEHYQMATHFAWSWKLLTLGVPTIFVYLGYLNAEEMRRSKTQKPFSDHGEWDAHVKEHSKSMFSESVWNRSWSIAGKSFVPLIRSTSVAFDGPIEGTATLTA